MMKTTALLPLRFFLAALGVMSVVASVLPEAA